MSAGGAGGARALLILTAAPGEEPPLTAQLAPVVDAARERLGEVVDAVSIGRRVESGAPGQEPYDAVASEGLSNGVRLGGFDAVVELSLRTLPGRSAAAELFRHSTDLLGGVIDPSRSSVAVGRLATIIEGSGPLRLVYCMRRLPTVTHQAFSDFWLHQHATVARLTAHICAYFQLHVDVERSRAAAAGAGVALDEIDGIALESFEDMDRFVRCVRPDASFAHRAQSSEETVNDLARVTAVLTAVEHVYRG